MTPVLAPNTPPTLADDVTCVFSLPLLLCFLSPVFPEVPKQSILVVTAKTFHISSLSFTTAVYRGRSGEQASENVVCTALMLVA